MAQKKPQTCSLKVAVDKLSILVSEDLRSRIAVFTSRGTVFLFFIAIYCFAVSMSSNYSFFNKHLQTS